MCDGPRCGAGRCRLHDPHGTSTIMAQWLTKISRRMLFTWFMLGGLIFLFAPPRVTGKLQLAYTRLFRWPLTRSRGLTIAARPLPQPDRPGAPDYDKVIAAQRQLRNHVANLEAQLEEAHKEIDRLARLRTIPQWNRMRFLLAEVITVTGQAAAFFTLAMAPALAVKSSS